jgi:hypothetical protein
MDLYLHVKSEHHPSKKQAVLKTLIHRARTLCDATSLNKEINHLKQVFRDNVYSSREVHRALTSQQMSLSQKTKPSNVAMIPLHSPVLNKISRLLGKYSIKTVHIPVRKNFSFVRPVKDKLGLKVAGIY